MNNPEYVKVDGKKYKINTDFMVAIECNEIAEDESIGNLERAMAIIYKLFGEEALKDTENYTELLELAKKYLTLGNDVDIKHKSKQKKDMDFKQDMDYIYASFMSDYQIDLTDKKMHWWTFFNLINGLSNSELGNCCILNRIRNLRNIDLTKIKDIKERKKIQEAQNLVKLKEKITEIEFTDEEKESMKKFDELLGLNRKE